MNGRNASEQILHPGKVLVSAIFDQISVHLVWHMGDLPSRFENARPASAIRTAEHPRSPLLRTPLAYARIAGSGPNQIPCWTSRIVFTHLHG